jgi:hypothetical protein
MAMAGFTVDQRADTSARAESRKAVFHDIVCGVDGRCSMLVPTEEPVE